MGIVFNFIFQTIYWTYFGYHFSFPSTFPFSSIFFYSFLLLLLSSIYSFIFEGTVGFLNVFWSSISAFPWDSFFLIGWPLSCILAPGYPWMPVPIGLGVLLPGFPRAVIFSKEQFFHLIFINMCFLPALNIHTPLGLAWPCNFLSEQRLFGE